MTRDKPPRLQLLVMRLRVYIICCEFRGHYHRCNFLKKKKMDNILWPQNHVILQLRFFFLKRKFLISVEECILALKKWFDNMYIRLCGYKCVNVCLCEYVTCVVLLIYINANLVSSMHSVTEAG